MPSRSPAGFIFGCTQETEHECRRKKLFGLPFCWCQDVERIRSGTPLFLYNYECKVLYGVFKARGKGRRDIDPDAWGGRFPAQIRVEGVMPHQRRGECLLKDDFQTAIRENFFTKHRFHYALTHYQVKRLKRLYEDARGSRRGKGFHPRRISKTSRISRWRKSGERRPRPFSGVQGQRVIPRHCQVEFQTPAHDSGVMETTEQMTFFRTPASNVMDFVNEVDELTPYPPPVELYSLAKGPPPLVSPQLKCTPLEGVDPPPSAALPRSSWKCEVLDLTIGSGESDESGAVVVENADEGRWAMDGVLDSTVKSNQRRVSASTIAEQSREKGMFSLDRNVQSLTEKFQRLWESPFSVQND